MLETFFKSISRKKQEGRGSMQPILIILICLSASYVSAEFFKRINLPKVLGPLSVGLIIGATPLKGYFVSPGDGIDIIDLFKSLALIFMLFFVGLKVNLKQFRRSSGQSVSVAIFASFLSLGLGFLLTVAAFHLGMLGPLGVTAESLYLVAFAVGICLSITAEAVAIEILEELKLLTSRIGETVIEAGIIDDVVGIFLIGGIVTMLHSATNPGIGILQLFLEIAFFVTLVFGIGVLLAPRLMKYVEKSRSKVDFFSIALIVALLLAVISLQLGFSSILGALFAGIIIRHTLLSGDRFEKRQEHQIAGTIETMTFGLLVPFFFIWIGLNTDITSLYLQPVFTILLIIVAFIGKIYGSVIGMGVAKGKKKEGYIIGWGMNIRGDVGYIVAALVLAEGLITKPVFSAIVVTGFITTFFSPVIFKNMLKRYHDIRH